MLPKLKIKLLMKNGLSESAATEEVMTEMDKKIKQMDLLLAKCVELLADKISPEEFEDLFGVRPKQKIDK